MNNVGLNFGQQIVSVSSEKPISSREQAQLGEMKKVLDQKLGKDVVNFSLKDEKNIEIVVNDPKNPEREQLIANNLRKMAGSIHPPVKNPPEAVQYAQTANGQPVVGGNLNVVA